MGNAPSGAPAGAATDNGRYQLNTSEWIALRWTPSAWAARSTSWTKSSGPQANTRPAGRGQVAAAPAGRRPPRCEIRRAGGATLEPLHQYRDLIVEDQLLGSGGAEQHDGRTALGKILEKRSEGSDPDPAGEQDHLVMQASGRREPRRRGLQSQFSCPGAGERGPWSDRPPCGPSGAENDGHRAWRTTSTGAPATTGPAREIATGGTGPRQPGGGPGVGLHRRGDDTGSSPRTSATRSRCRRLRHIGRPNR